MTAQEAFKQMLREHVSPALRADGLKGSGGTYSLPSTTHWVLLGFQRSTSSDASAVKFTVNCKVVDRQVWEQMRQAVYYLSEKPSPNVGSGSFEWDKRLGVLMPQQEDRWWWLRPDDDLQAVAADVVHAIRTFGLPAMRKQASGES
jgi:hypothetical protein